MTGLSTGAFDERAAPFWQAALDSLPDSVAVLDHDGVILAVNQTWRAFAETNHGFDVGVGINYLSVCDRSGASDPIAVEVSRGARGPVRDAGGLAPHPGDCDQASGERRPRSGPPARDQEAAVGEQARGAELLPPVLEIIGLIGTAVGVAIGQLEPGFLFLFALVVYGYGLVLNAISLALEELSFPRYPRLRDRLLLFLWMALENVGYRQLRSLWAIQGIWKYVRGNREWGTDARALGRAGRSERPARR